MEARFVLPDLENLDSVRCDALAVPFFAGELPTRGVLGLVDWRLCGLISRMVVRKQITGAWKEVVLLPGYPRLSMDKVMLYGLGPSEDFREKRQQEAVRRLLTSLAEMTAHASAIVLPGRGDESANPARAIEVFMRVARSCSGCDEIIIVDSAEAQKTMLPLLERERRKARSDI